MINFKGFVCILCLMAASFALIVVASRQPPRQEGGYGEPLGGLVITEAYDVERIIWRGGSSYSFLAREWKTGKNEGKYFWRRWSDSPNDTVTITIDEKREKPNKIRRNINNPNTGYNIEIEVRSGKDIEFVPSP